MGAAWLIITVTSAWFAAKVNGECAPGNYYWEPYDSLGYSYRVICWVGYVNIETAEKQCEYEGGKLASVHSEYENKVVTETAYGNVFDSSVLTWIGLRKVGGSWRWTDGTYFDYSNWAPTQPDNYYGHATESPELCVQIYRSGEWNDLKCNGRVYQAVCKKKYIRPWRSYDWESTYPKTWDYSWTRETTTRAPVEMEKVAESWITMEKLSPKNFSITMEKL